MPTEPSAPLDPQPPYADPPKSTMPPASEALLRRLNAWAQRMQATYPEHAEAIRKRKTEQEASRDDAAGTKEGDGESQGARTKR